MVLRAAILCLLCLCAPLAATAQELARLDADSPTLALAAPLQWQALPKGAVANPDEFQATSMAAGFAAMAAQTVLPTSAEQDVWLRFALPATAKPEPWYLRVPHLSLQRGTLYFQDPAKGWLMQSAGEDVAMGQWPVPSSRPTFALQTRTDGAQPYYLKLEYFTDITGRPELISANEYVDDSTQTGILIGLMFGAFSLLGVLGLLAARIYRNPNFARFALLVFLLMLVQLVLVGHAGQRFWPHSSYLNQTMCWLSWLWFLAATAWFSAQVSLAREAFPKIYYASMALSVTLLGLSLVYALAHASVPRHALNALAALAMLWIVGSSAWMAWRSQPWLWYLTAGLAPLLLTLLARIGYNLRWVGHIEVAQLVSLTVGCLGMLAIYWALLVRSRESQVALDREAALSSTDASTGLSLARVVAVRLPLVLARSERFEEPCGVLMVRWLDYAKFMEPLSSTERGAALAHIGARLRKLGRPIDTVARMDDDHFVFLIESPISRDRLNALGTKILATCMRPGRPQVDSNEYNVHIAVWASGKGNMAADQVLEALRTRLNQMGNGTSRRVQFVDSAPSSRPGEGHSEIPNITVAAPFSSSEIVAKINAIEATPIIPTIAVAAKPVPKKTPS